MAITPWPDDPGERALASWELSNRMFPPVGGNELWSIGERQSDDRIRSLGPAASAMVERYAPGAPQGVRDEACARIAGYLHEATFGQVSKEIFGPTENEYVTNHGDAFRRSGAAMLLSPWRVRRAGLVG